MNATQSLQDELRRCLRSAQGTEDGAVALEFFYPEKFTGFQGHFPGNPILPGVCILQSLRVGLEQAWQTPLRMVEIVSAKFVTPARPAEKLLYTARESARNDGFVTVKARVTRDGERVAEFTVKLQQDRAQ